MSADDLSVRVRRIYAAIAASQEADLNKMPAKMILTEKVVGISQDFDGGLKEEELSNAAHQVIHNIANLRDNLKRWAEQNSKDPQRVWDTFNASLPIRVIQDLSNNDKHGYPPRDGQGNSGIAPTLSEIHRVMRLTAKPGAALVMTLGAGGKPKVSGDGSAIAVITGTVASKDGKVIGELYEIEQEAIQAWEVLLKEYGIV